MDGLARRAGSAALIVVGLVALTAVCTVPLSTTDQAWLAGLTVAIFLIANRFRGRIVTLALMALSISVSLRYAFWRISDTLHFASASEAILGVGLLLAEAYAILVLFLGYLQTAWPLDRKPVPLPDDPAAWPQVDVFIPTYSEPLSVVRPTVLAALALDWPADKLRVILLDDGRRPEFGEFAREAGCEYLTRPDNRHAKAGNLNHALTKTSGALVAVFDCDHVPNRAFLQLTAGAMLADPKLALLQTPHHFYSPDPFQRNLAAGERVPPEGNLFYGLLQPGNDYWNAAFFCGSCALLRRAALASIGGFAVETVTEDAHTMLRMHRRGWHSAYLRFPLAAGLATERLALHVGQRRRWARGMIQILRIDNPMLGPGLTLAQRLCYTQAAGHFLFAVPRIVFLTSPLAFLLLFQNIFAASPLAILAYGLPHIVHSVATASRVQRNWRHSFWSEIYETVLALWLVRLTVATLWDPKRGKFNVTEKGGLLEHGYFDWGATWPNIVLASLLGAGILRGIASLVFADNDQLTLQALLMNTIWAVFSLLIVLAAIAVGAEQRQVRTAARLDARIPASIHLADGRVFAGETSDVSQGGCRIVLPRPDLIGDEALAALEFDLADGPAVVPGRLLDWSEDAVLTQFEARDIEDESALVRVVFGRADAWMDWSDFPRDRVWHSLWRVLVSIGGLRRTARLRQKPPRAGAALAGRAAVALAALVLPVLAAQAQTTIRPLPQAPASLLPGLPDPPLPSEAPKAQLPPATGPDGASPPQQAAPGEAAAAPAAGTRRILLTLHDLGAQGPLYLRGTSELQGVQFGVREDEVVTEAELTLWGAMSPALLPEFSNDTVMLNDQYVGTIPVTAGRPRFDRLRMPVNPVMFQENNRLNFRFAGRYTRDCNDPLSPLLWSNISDASTLALTVARVPVPRDLSRLPVPFFDPRDKRRLALPFILPAQPQNEVLRAAGIAASWFGAQAAYRGASFPVLGEPPADGNAVLFFTGAPPRGLAMPPLEGPTVAIVPNPAAPDYLLLVIAGRDPAEVATAASAVSLGGTALAGDMATVSMPDAAPRHPYDAPAWIPTDRKVRLGELVDGASLQTVGYTGLVHVPFRTSPDLYTWRGGAFPVRFDFRAPPGPVVDVAPSRVDVAINGAYLNSVPMAETSWLARGWNQLLASAGWGGARGRADIPPYRIFARNDLTFFFDARPLHRGECAAIPGDLTMGIDPNSTIDLSRAYHFAVMPNLGAFAGAAYPFTRLADLAETAVMLPEQPGPFEIKAFLDLMGHVGATTGYPAIRLRVARPREGADLAGRDVLILGTVAHIGDAGGLLAGAPVSVKGGRLDYTLGDRLPLLSLFSSDQEARDALHLRLSGNLGANAALLVGAESPLASGRSVVALLGGSPEALGHLVASLEDASALPQIQGDITILTGKTATSWRVGPTYTVGHLAPWVWPAYWLGSSPLALALILAGSSLVLGFGLFRVLGARARMRIAADPALVATEEN